jgi:pyridoxamine-phosphate oxidase
MAELNQPPDDPVPTVVRWLAEAEALGRRNANAIALASTDAAGRPSVRMVLLKELAPAGYAVFYTNYGSRKAAELEATRRAAAVLYWHELGRQVRFEGRVVRSPDAESDAYFLTRPWRSQVNAWSSEQSRPIADVAELERRSGRRFGAGFGCGSMPSSFGSRARTAFTSACATSASCGRGTPILSAVVAGSGSACSPR